ncbi:phage integrase family protein [Paraburkholderia eburnea]|uniref:Phage integrase family protein n=1 Tax=Paraburkholderia eburnea TaxID=1189126 RepID=A0A2S4M524_9BURK|nr:site-specific integrase [Paraburkholderia eburnea]POR49792.1 phage integrase family protein [Paraburkholderia eburnea]PRZ20220.1 phage integrase family protein [Paraburkholderia eburnea]
MSADAEQVPKGIEVIKWTNGDKSKSIRYRVRVKRLKKGIDYNETFESLPNAIEARKAVLNGDTPEKRPVAKNLTQHELGQLMLSKYGDDQGVKLLTDTPFSFYAKKYFEGKIEGKDLDKPTGKFNEDSTKYRLKSILDTPIEYKRNADSKVDGIWETLLVSTKTTLGNIPAKFLDHVAINSYIQTALKKKAKSTVKRELGVISAIVNYTMHVAPDFYKKHWLINPVKLADKSRLTGHNAPLDRRISPEQEEAVINALANYSNQEVNQIFILSLLTGARRSEILFLEWSQIKDSHIYLGVTKSGKPRKLLLRDEAKEALALIQKRENSPRLFTYSLSGFAGIWQKLKKEYGFTEVKFHDCRREFIARFLELMGNKSVIAIANMTGQTDLRHLEKTIEALEQPDLSTEKGLQKHVGHSSLNMLRHYASGLLNQKK